MVSIKNRCIWKKQVWASDSCETFFSGFHNIKKDQQQKLSFNFRFQGRPSPEHSGDQLLGAPGGGQA